MSRKMEADWSDWKGHVEKQEHPLSRPLKKGMTGAEAAASALLTGLLPVMKEAPRQPTDEEMFGHLAVSEEQLAKARQEWEDKFKTLDFKGKIDHLNKSKVDERTWGHGKSFNSMLTKEELAERNKHAKDE